jgi:hypothetical protein
MHMEILANRVTADFHEAAHELLDALPSQPSAAYNAPRESLTPEELSPVERLEPGVLDGGTGGGEYEWEMQLGEDRDFNCDTLSLGRREVARGSAGVFYSEYVCYSRLPLERWLFVTARL